MAVVLIIESDSAVATSLSDALSVRGVETRVVGDGAEGLKIARDEQPDAIVLCVELSRVSGYSICNKLKKSPALAKIPLVLTSDKATEETFEQHKKLKTRAEQYLKKPFDLDQMLGLIAQYIDLEVEADEEEEDEVEVEMDDLQVEVTDADEFEVAFDEDGVTSPDALADAGFGGDDDDFASTQVMALPKDFLENAKKAAVEAEAGALDESVASEPKPAKRTRKSAVASGRGESPGTSAQVDRLRDEVKQLRDKTKSLEEELENKEAEFTDRLLQESSRSREGIELKKKVGQMERELTKQKQATEEAEEKASQITGQVESMQAQLAEAGEQKDALTEKIAQLVDKLKALVAERDEIRAELDDLGAKKSGVEEDMASADQLRAKAKKAVDIAMQLLDDTGLVQ